MFVENGWLSIVSASAQAKGLVATNSAWVTACSERKQSKFGYGANDRHLQPVRYLRRKKSASFSNTYQLAAQLPDTMRVRKSAVCFINLRAGRKAKASKNASALTTRGCLVSRVRHFLLPVQTTLCLLISVNSRASRVKAYTVKITFSFYQPNHLYRSLSLSPTYYINISATVLNLFRSSSSHSSFWTFCLFLPNVMMFLILFLWRWWPPLFPKFREPTPSSSSFFISSILAILSVSFTCFQVLCLVNFSDYFVLYFIK